MVKRAVPLCLSGALATGCPELNPDFMEPPDATSTGSGGGSDAGADSESGASSSEGGSSSSSEASSSGDPCASERLLCDEECIDPSSDPLNCGGCGVDCADRALNSICVNGACACPPGPGWQVCGELGCVDTNSDRQACGPECIACASDETCVSGSCDEDD